MATEPEDPEMPETQRASGLSASLPRWIPRSVLARPRAWLLGILAASVPFVVALPRLELRTDGEALHPERDPVIAATLQDRQLFRDPEALIVLVVPRETRDGIFTPAGLAAVKALTETLRTVPGVRSDDVLSIATALDVTASTETIRLTHFLDVVPTTMAEIRDLRHRLERDEVYEGLLYGRDGRSAAILVPLVPAEPRVGSVRRVRATLEAVRHAGFDVRLTGPVVAEVLLGEQILGDLTRLVPGVVTVVAVTLLLSLRSAGGALIPLAEMFLVLLWTFGAMASLRFPLTLVTSVLPVLLMAMAVTDVLHLLERFQAHWDGATRAEALARALTEVGPPIVRTSITTALGFLSFLSTSVPSMRHFGLFAGLGLVFAMAFSFTLVPAMLLVLPERWLRPAGGGTRGAIGGVEGWASAHPGAAMVVAIVSLALALGGLPRLEVQDSWVRNFMPRSDLVVADGILNREYRGSYRLTVTVASDRDGVFRRAEGVALLDSLQRVLAAFPEVSATQSPVDLARIGLRGVEPGRDVRGLGDDALAQLFLMLEISGVQEWLSRFVTPSGREARIQCFVRDADYARSARLLARIEAMRARLETGSSFRLRATGDVAIATQVVRATVSNQVRSIVLTIAGLAVYLGISFRSLPVAAMLLTPVVATTLVVFGGMGYLGIALGVATSMFAALAAGEGVDFAIHIVSRYRDVVRHRKPEDAMHETLASVGRAVRWNGLALVAGCLVLCLSALKPVRALGGLLAAGIGVSYLMAFLFLPFMLLRRAGRGKARGGRAGVAVLPAAALILGLCGAPTSCWGEAPRDSSDDAAARRLLAEIERDQRSGHRMFAMTCSLTTGGQHPTRISMLGLSRGDRKLTRILYVMTSPKFFRGATLVIQDSVESSRRDRMWLALPGLGTFREIEATSLRLLVPGTGLTYEDSRGWIPPEKYRLRTVAAGEEEATVEARPSSDSLSRLLGVSRLDIRLDPRRRVVTRVVSYDEAGNITRTYEAEEFTSLEGRWFPERLRTTQRAWSLEAVIGYRYAVLKRPPPETLFQYDAQGPTFLDRLLEWRARKGLAATFPDTIPAR